MRSDMWHGLEAFVHGAATGRGADALERARRWFVTDAYLDKVDIAELREVQWLTLPGGVKIGDVRFKGAIRGVLLVHNEGITFAPGKAGGHFR